MDKANKTVKDNILKRNNKQCLQQNKFLKGKKETNKNKINIFNQNNKIYKANSYIDKRKNNYNTSCNNTNREILNLLEEKNSANITNRMNLNDNNCNNLKYESRISKLETEINELKFSKEKIKENLIPFLFLVKKYSSKLSTITKNFTSDNSFLTPDNYKEIILIINNLSKVLNNPQLNRDIYQIAGFSKFFCPDNSLQNEITCQTNNDNTNKESLEDFKNSVEEIINKYEKKINILNEENGNMVNRINLLKEENNRLKEQLNEEKKIKEDVLNKLNKLKEENIYLEKKNRVLDYKCTSYFNKSTQSKYEQRNIEGEIEFKNKIIKYLENLLKNTGFKGNEEIYKTNIHKVIDLKKNLKEVIKGNRNYFFQDENNIKSSNSFNLLSNEKSKCIENGSRIFNEKSNSSNSFKSNNNKQIKKEIDILDKEIEDIQSKLENMIKQE